AEPTKPGWWDRTSEEQRKKRPKPEGGVEENERTAKVGGGALSSPRVASQHGSCEGELGLKQRPSPVSHHEPASSSVSGDVAADLAADEPAGSSAAAGEEAEIKPVPEVSRKRRGWGNGLASKSLQEDGAAGGSNDKLPISPLSNLKRPLVAQAMEGGSGAPHLGLKRIKTELAEEGRSSLVISEPNPYSPANRAVGQATPPSLPPPPPPRQRYTGHDVLPNIIMKEAKRLKHDGDGESAKSRASARLYLQSGNLFLHSASREEESGDNPARAAQLFNQTASLLEHAAKMADTHRSNVQEKGGLVAGVIKVVTTAEKALGLRCAAIARCRAISVRKRKLRGILSSINPAQAHPGRAGAAPGAAPTSAQSVRSASTPPNAAAAGKGAAGGAGAGGQTEAAGGPLRLTDDQQRTLTEHLQDSIGVMQAWEKAADAMSLVETVCEGSTGYQPMLVAIRTVGANAGYGDMEGILNSVEDAIDAIALVDKPRETI
ncbi:hypothetical protein CYMTET_27692, partial [Cymbomonas tetramitiformis]